MSSVSRARSGKWEARYRDEAGKSRSKTFPKKDQAQRFLRVIDALKEPGFHLSAPLAADESPLFGPWAEEYLDERIGLRPATVARDLSLFRNHLKPAFEHHLVGRIRRSHVRAWIADLERKGLAPRTSRECYRLLSYLMREAVEEGLIRESPCRRVKLPRLVPKERRYLSTEEVARLVDATPDPYKMMIMTAVWLGCRWQELAGLKRQHLDLFRRELRIEGTIERVGGGHRYVGETKSSSSRRLLRVPKWLVMDLARHLETTPKSEFVFCTPSGKFLRDGNFRKRVWNKAVRDAGLAPLTFHELRHTCAAFAIDEGANPLALARRLGHKDISTTLNIYGHLYTDREDELNDRLGDKYEEVRQSLVRHSRDAGTDEEAN